MTALFVVVNGPPGSGKSTLAGGLADRLDLPLIAKDTIKEALMSVLHVPDVEASRRLGRAAIAAMLRTAATCRTGAVLDANFRRGLALNELGQLPGQIVEVFCVCSRGECIARYRERGAERAPGHFDAARTDDDIWNEQSTQPVDGGWPVVRVDTERPVRLDEVVGSIDSALVSTGSPAPGYVGTASLGLASEQQERTPGGVVDSVERIERATAFAEEKVRGVRAEDMAKGTPCAEFDVKALLDHLIGNLGMLVTAARGERGERPEGAQFDDDPGAVYGDLRDELLVALAVDGVFDRQWQMPFGDLPGSVMASIAFMEHLTHGWDVATATGQDATIPSDLVEACMGAAIAVGDTLRMPGVCGPAVAVPDDASAQDKLIAFMGRTP